LVLVGLGGVEGEELTVESIRERVGVVVGVMVDVGGPLLCEMGYERGVGKYSKACRRRGVVGSLFDY
jgi:hypothetical protein